MQSDALYDALLDTLYKTFGHHPGFRVAHAKGILVSGNFMATEEAAGLSKAAHFQGASVPVLLRFSNFSGLPATRDGDPEASPHGLAIRFFIPEQQITDIVAHSYDGFPVATPEAFLAFLSAISANVASPPDPVPLNRFLAIHPRARHFLDNATAAPVSYFSNAYFGVNAFTFIDACENKRYGRYRIEPVTPAAALSEAQARISSENYLQDDAAVQLSAGPVRMRLMLQLACTGDNVADGSLSWPRSNPEIELGTLTLHAVLPPDQQDAQARLAFNPGRLVPGIEKGPDLMIAAREEIYKRAMTRRSAMEPVR
ncbi:catalase family peroxidase [Pantoea anthophila]|uniref:catalase family peroxidase n=1 Tax=Pantoea anthophila TaxID=470931 RepID=UPI002DBC0A61|nr:catalase family peroxidase [Pantoea anthophila]MEB7538547.1 catalase family peroxidase [Pantoea anthophila]